MELTIADFKESFQFRLKDYLQSEVFRFDPITQKDDYIGVIVNPEGNYDGSVYIHGTEISFMRTVANTPCYTVIDLNWYEKV